MSDSLFLVGFFVNPANKNIRCTTGVKERKVQTDVESKKKTFFYSWIIVKIFKDLFLFNLKKKTILPNYRFK